MMISFFIAVIIRPQHGRDPICSCGICSCGSGAGIPIRRTQVPRALGRPFVLADLVPESRHTIRTNGGWCTPPGAYGNTSARMVVVRASWNLRTLCRDTGLSSARTKWPGPERGIADWWLASELSKLCSVYCRAAGGNSAASLRRSSSKLVVETTTRPSAEAARRQ